MQFKLLCLFERIVNYLLFNSRYKLVFRCEFCCGVLPMDENAINRHYKFCERNPENDEL